MRLSSSLFAAGLFLLGWLGMSALSIRPSLDAVVTIDMRVNQDTLVQVFWDEFDEAPAQKEIRAGERTQLKLTLPRSNIYRLRIDPTERNGDDISIYHVGIQLSGRPEVEIPLETIAGTWAFHDTTKPALAEGVLKLGSTSGDPYFYGAAALPAPSRFDALWSSTARYIRSDLILIHVVVLGSFAALFMVIRRAVAITAIVSFLLLYLALRHGPDALLLLFGPDHLDVSQSVGRASFSGTSVAPARWTTVVAGLLALFMGILLAKRNNGIEKNAAPYAVKSLGHFGPKSALVGVVLVAMLVYALTPDLRTMALQRMSTQFLNGWDQNLITTWSGFIARGQRPYIDFWYPYSGLWVFQLPLPRGPMLHLIYEVLLYGVLAAAVWRLTDRRVVLFGLILGIVVLLAGVNILPAADRYLLAPTVAMSYVAIERPAKTGHSGRIWFWAACALALWVEPAQLVYAAPAVLIALVVDELQSQNFALRDAFARMARDFLIPFACMIFLAAFLVWRGELQGFIETNIENAAVAWYGLLPTPIDSQVGRPLTIPGIGIVVPYGLIFIGTVLCASGRSTAERKQGLAALCLGIIGIALLQKHLIRSLDNQLLFPTVLGAFALLAFSWRHTAARLLTAGLLGAGCAAFALNGTVAAQGKALILGGFDRSSSTLRTLAADQPLLQAANDAAFAEGRFANFKQELAAAKAARSIGDGSLFVLGDMAIFYLFSPSANPFHVNMYNASPVTAQVLLRDWLSTTKPNVVILDPNALKFDEVQMVVRVPIVVQQVVSDYVPQSRIGPYQLLRRRAADEAIPLAFWRDYFGTTVDYGHLLQQIRSARLPACPLDNMPAMCVRYLQLEFSTDAPKQERVELPVDVGSMEFRISFIRYPGNRTYLLPIDRLWFWRAGEQMGLSPHLHEISGAPKTTILAKMTKKPVLY